MLAKVFNSVIATSDAKAHAKKTAMIKFKTPKQFDENGKPIKKVVITLEEKKTKFAHVKVAKLEEALDGKEE